MKFFFFFLALVCCAYGDLDTPETENAILRDETLFVSLGSTCEIADMLRFSEMRKAAFPFDWVVSVDGEKLIELLDNDFLFFTDESHLMVGPLGPGFLMQTQYRMEFLHEGDFRGDQFVPNLQKLKAKYERRIDRFRKLNEYTGKVYFFRSAFLYSLTDPHRFYFSRENIELTDDFSQRLFEALKNYFPDLDFTLIIVNLSDAAEILEDKKLSDRLIKIRANPLLERPLRIAAYKRYFTELAEEAAP